MVELIPVL